jgi:hypothetical protein
MMYLVATVIVIGAVTVLNLVLTYGVIRRLRQHTDLLSKRATPPSQDLMRPVGTTVDDFDVAADDGGRVVRAGLSGYAAIAFVSPGCQPCTDLTPRLLTAGRAGHVLAVVLDHPDDAEYRAQLSAAATVIGGAASQPVIDAFGVSGFPAVCRVDDHGVITATGTWLVDERHPVAV